MHRRFGCRSSDHPSLGRRDLLQMGGLTLFGVGLADLLRMEGEAAKTNTGSNQNRPFVGTAKSIVFIFQSGGPSQHETFDPKPQAPDTIRGEFSAVQTRVSGEMFCEHLPKLAARSDKFSVVRTMHHVADREFRNEHNSCQYMIHTCTTALPVGDTNASIVKPRAGRVSWPSLGSLVAYATPSSAETGLPSVVEIPRTSHMKAPGRESGMLGPLYDRLGVDLAPPCSAEGGSCPDCFRHADPNLDPERLPGRSKAWWDHSSCRNPSFHLPNFSSIDAIALSQFENRQTLLRELDQLKAGLDRTADVGPLNVWDVYRQQAMRFVMSARPGSQNPFDLSQESDRVRDLYGREEWGQAFLVARRLVESGVRMVQVNLRGWDTHQNAFRDLKNRLLPALDRCLSGFLDDLSQRGLLDETLIVMCGEMGRTPRISPITPGGKNVAGEVFTPGRHHWGDIFPCFLAGGGIQPGRIIGQSDAHAGLPTGDAFTPEDLAATIFHCLGVPRDREFHDAAGRPYQVYRGKPITQLL